MLAAERGVQIEQPDFASVCHVANKLQRRSVVAEPVSERGLPKLELTIISALGA